MNVSSRCRNALIEVACLSSGGFEGEGILCTRPRSAFQTFSTAVQDWLEQIVRSEFARSLLRNSGNLAPMIAYFAMTSEGVAALSERRRLSRWWTRMQEYPSVVATDPGLPNSVSTKS